MSEWQKHFSAGELSGAAPIENRDFTGASLRGANLAKRMLVGCTFSGCDLTGIELDGATLSKCNFAGAVLRDAKLSSATVQGCDFTGADVSGCEATGTNFGSVTWQRGRAARADFAKSSFIDVDLRDADLTGAVLRGATLLTSNLAGAKLAGADLQRLARFKDCDLRGVDIAGALLGSTQIVDCAVYGMKGSPREPYDVTVKNVDLSAARDGSKVSGWAGLAELWRAQRATDSNRAPFELGERLSSEDDEGFMLMSVLEAAPALDTLFDTNAPVFPVMVPWFADVRVFALGTTKDAPRVVCAARLPDDTVEVLEGSPQALTRAAAAEPVRIADADAAVRYARFGYYVTAGGGTFVLDGVEQTGAGWVIRASSVVDGLPVANRLTVGRDGAFANQSSAAS